MSAFTTSQPSKTSGQFHSMKGSAMEGVGNMTGATEWQRAGKEEHAAGETEYKAAQAKNYAEGTADRFGGKKDSIIGAVTGDKSQQMEGNARNEKGSAQQEMNKNI
ncbi:mismatched base pair and cruciform DNA recognition protein [Coprinopsis marcescibilis]|uniref:Mismatched base pair and cruciform DNA recognition protein n=1 Tax=Coprinopsis marcescibilis TaxID=230819 RepID=A0A5C3KI58_COPMA|nr:mismatched base pair and cruciform DNA recognition protein [Coprinopsis marcescibilis]